MLMLYWRTFYVGFVLLIILIALERLKYRRLAPAIAALIICGWLVIFSKPEVQAIFGTTDPSIIMGIYVSRAYRTEDKEIRFYYMMDMENNNEIQYLDGSEWRPLLSRCICPIATWVSQCTVEGHLGIASFTRSHNAEVLKIRTRYTAQPYLIPLEDARIQHNHTYAHELGVCLQPVYFHADWTAYAQYLEFWTAAGATKFYLYIHSASPKVRLLLSQYKRVFGKKLEIVDWSDLPVQERYKGDFYADPNTRIFSAGGHTALNECILRARSHVKFLAVADLDEVFHVATRNSVVKTLRELDRQHPKAAQFAFNWVYVQDESNTRNVTRVSEIDFTSLASLRRPKSENIIHDYVVMKKLIHRPERVVMSDVHLTLVNDLIKRRSHSPEIRFDTSITAYPWNIPAINERYQEVKVNESYGAMLHVRRFDPLSTVEVPYDRSSFRSIAVLSEKMTRQWKLRLTSGQIPEFEMGNWYPTFEQTMRDLENCRVYPFNVMLRIGKGLCRALVNCEPMLTVREAYKKADQIWTNVAHRGRYIAYVKA